jgi:hypothetical protein
MSKNLFLALKAFLRHCNKYDFTHAHRIHATKEERHNQSPLICSFLKDEKKNNVK